MCPTYDVVTYDVHTISSKPTLSYVRTTMSNGIYRMRHRRSWTAHRTGCPPYRMRHRMRQCSGIACDIAYDFLLLRSRDQYCCISRSDSGSFWHCNFFYCSAHKSSTQIKLAPRRPQPQAQHRGSRLQRRLPHLPRRLHSQTLNSSGSSQLRPQP
jgi:hypothetical protein